MFQSVAWEVATCVTVCRCCATCRVRISCKSPISCIVLEVTSMRLVAGKVIDVSGYCGGRLFESVTADYPL
jgi:hypothetical protein